MRKISQWIDSLIMDYHWSVIGRYRRNASQLIEQGAACCDPRLVKLSNRILSHGMQVSRIWRVVHRRCLVCELAESITV